LYYSKAGSKNVETIQGSAHWASQDEIIEAGLLDMHGKPNPEGVVVGGYQPGKKDSDIKILRHNGKEHILCYAPTRSGKGVSLVFPTLLDGWNQSTFVFDIKGENFAGSAGYRKSIGHKILKLDFTDPYALEKRTSATFNPLEEVALDYVLPEGYEIPKDENGQPKIREPFELLKSDTFNETSTIQQIVAIIIDPQGKGLDDHWAKTASSFMLGAITHLLYKHQYFKKPCPGISDVLSELTQPGKKWQDVVMSWIDFPHKGIRKDLEPISHPIVMEEAQTLLNKPEKEAGSVLSTVIANLALFRDPIVSQNTSQSSFRIRDLMNHESPVDLYLIVNPNDQLRLLPITRLFTTQLIFTLVQKMDFKSGRTYDSYKHRLLLLLDEFPSLGRMDLFEKALGFIGGYGLKAFIVCQGLSQLFKAYGKDESLRVGCHIQIAFAPNELDTSEYLSKLTGQMTIMKENVTETRQDGRLIGGNSRQISLQEIQRSLLTADECRRLPAMKKDSAGNVIEAGDMLVFPAGFSPIYGRQTLYFKNKIMDDRSRIPPPTLSDNLISTPAKTFSKTATQAMKTLKDVQVA
jgi:type IV secretion system protein VirD4